MKKKPFKVEETKGEMDSPSTGDKDIDKEQKREQNQLDDGPNQVRTSVKTCSSFPNLMYSQLFGATDVLLPISSTPGSPNGLLIVFDI